jgi:hypothetical protein
MTTMLVGPTVAALPLESAEEDGQCAENDGEDRSNAAYGQSRLRRHVSVAP